ncbi:MAG: DUF4129 domain-containing protein [Thermoplasmata archaeon]|nr:DUF4129 domain-containing protein [Thermoplasmata archaeon]
MAVSSRRGIITMVLLVVIIFCIGNLIFNVERLDIGDEIILDTPESSGSDSYVASSTSIANTVRYLLIGLMAIGIAITIGGIIWGTATKDKAFLKSVLYPIIGGGLAIILFVGVIAYTQIEKSEYTQNELLDTYSPSNGTASDGSLPSNIKPDGMDITISIMFLVGAVAVVALFIFAVTQITHLRSEKYPDVDMDAVAEEVGQTIQRAIDDMTTGTDVRSSIMRCYRDMCKLAAQHGISDEEHLTPREFESRIGSRLPITDEKLHDLILIFEEARYSDHSLSEEMRERAMKALNTIKDDLVIEEKIDESTTSGLNSEGGELAG